MPSIACHRVFQCSVIVSFYNLLLHVPVFAAQKIISSHSEFLLPAVALCVDSTWRPCNVTAFSSSSHMFHVKFEHEREGLLLPRLHVCFDMESVNAFVQRVRQAVGQRDEAISALRRRLYIDCMPKDDIATPTEETMRHAVRLALSTMSMEDNVVSSSLPALKQVRAASLSWAQK